jgi:dihydroorotate dehydrogenase electron transfer subunit
MAEAIVSQINRSAAQMNATVLANKRVGQYHQIVFGIGDLVKSCRPGNFVAIKVGGDSSRMILRRAFAISRVAESVSFGGTMELIVAPHGTGSKWLCSQPEGAEVDIVAPLFGLAEVLKTRGCKVDMLLGASTGAKIYAPMEGKRAVNSLKIYTEDGTMGETGRVTEPIKTLIENREVDVIYSCGPMGMLSAISALTLGTDVVHQCAVEEAMACGIGICMTCVLPVMGEDGKVAMLRSCIDGPVMDGAQVQWQLVGQVPEGTP